MKVKELMAVLETMPKDMEVHIAYNYGDYWRTIVAPSLKRVGIDVVVHSEYHQLDRLADEHKDEFIPSKEVVVLR